MGVYHWSKLHHHSRLHLAAGSQYNYGVLRRVLCFFGGKGVFPLNLDGLFEETFWRVNELVALCKILYLKKINKFLKEKVFLRNISSIFVFYVSIVVIDVYLMNS